MPFLLDLLVSAGILADVIDGTIGGASAFLYTGRDGWVLTGDPAQPAAVGYSSVVSYTGSSTAAVLRPGDVGFDPCSLLSRIAVMAAGKLSRVAYDDVWLLWGQSESDVSYGQPAFYGTYRDALLVIGDYLVAAGARRVLYSLSVQKDIVPTSQMQYLQLAISEAVASRVWAARGADLFAHWGLKAPLIPEAAPNEATRVHLDLRGQQIYAQLEFNALRAAGAL